MVDERADEPGAGEDAAQQELPALPEGYQYGPGVKKGLAPDLGSIASLLTTFSRFARSLGFYNASNRAVSNFFDKLWADLQGVLERRDVMVLEVRPTAFEVDGASVYEDADREHSIPFKLYRDGIRQLTFGQGLQQEELMELARILGMRQTGVNRHGDDMVTRLWKADFPSIRYSEIKGFVSASEVDSAAVGGGDVPAAPAPDEPAPPSAGPAAAAALAGVDLAATHWVQGVYPGRDDYELELNDTGVEVLEPTLEEAELEAFRAELDAEERQLLTQLVAYLLDLSVAEREVFRVEQLRELVRDGKRYLLSEGKLDELGALVRHLADVAGSGEFGREMEALAGELLDELADGAVLQQMVSAADPEGDGPATLRGALAALGTRVGREDLFALLGCEMLPPLREALLDQLVVCPGVDVGWLRDRLGGDDPFAARAAVDGLARLPGDAARDALLATVHHDDPELRRYLVEVLERGEYDEAARRALCAALADRDAEVRSRALAALVRRQDPQTLDALRALAERAELASWPADEARSLLTALAKLGGGRMLVWFRERIKTPRIWSLLTTEQRAFNELALPALEAMGTATARDELRRLKDVGPEEFRREALKRYVALDRALRGEQRAREGR